MKMKREIMAIARAMGRIMEDKRSPGYSVTQRIKQIKHARERTQPPIHREHGE